MKTITLEENKKSVGHEIAYGYSLDIGNTFILDSIARDIDHALTTYAEAVATKRVKEERERITEEVRLELLKEAREWFDEQITNQEKRLDSLTPTDNKNKEI